MIFLLLLLIFSYSLFSRRQSASSAFCCYKFLRMMNLLLSHIHETLHCFLDLLIFTCFDLFFPKLHFYFIMKSNQMTYFCSDADASELISAQRRDDEQIQWIYDRVSDCVLRLFGERVWIRCHRWLPSFSVFIYLSMTSLCEKQTIGEEYVGLVQVGTNRLFPSLLRRLSFVLLEVVFRVPFPSFLLLQRHHLVHQILSIFHSIGIGQIYSAWFFFSDSFFLRLSKRLSSIRYLSLRPRPNSIPRKFFQLVGFATLIQFAVVLMSNIAKLVKDSKQKQLLAQNEQQSENKRQQNSKENGFFCKICSAQLVVGQMSRPVCLPCGHSLCSDCLVSLSSRNNSNDVNMSIECPFCRKKSPLNRIVFPLNL